MAIPVGGRGAGFFLVSDWTRASQGGSFGLGVSLALLELGKEYIKTTERNSQRDPRLVKS